METLMPQAQHDSHSRRGGKRSGSGRKPLVETDECRWIVTAIRKIAESENIMALRMQQAVMKQNPKFVESHSELNEEYSRLRGASVSQRRQWIMQDVGTPLEEIRALREQPGFHRLIHVPVPNQFHLNKIYKRVADEASIHFQKSITLRKVKDCSSAWVKFEREIERVV
jgi:hypothetical protein